MVATPSHETSALLQHADSIEIDLDDLPIITRTNSFSLTSPSYALSQSDLKVVLDYEDEPEPDWRVELSKQLKLMYPIMLTYLLEYAPGLVCIMLVGHLDSPDTKLYVDAATMSTMFTNISALSIGFGLSSALDTLCSQAYGAGRRKKIGIYLQSAFIVVGSCLLPIFLLNWHSGTFLRLAGQDPDVARYAGEFSQITVFGTPFLFVYEMCRKLLQAQNIVRPLVVIMIMGNCVNLISGYYLTYHTSMGFHGAALSRTLGYMTLAVGLVPYFWYTKSYEAWWPGWDLKAAWQHVRIFLHLGIPGMLMMTMEWWAYEILAILAGWLPNGVVEVSAHAVLMTVASSMYMIFLGMAVSGNILVGNALGANQPKKARLISRLTMTMVVSMSTLVALGVYIFRHDIPSWLINDQEAIQRASETLLVMVPYEIVDATNCVIQGIYRGTGRQHMAAKTNAIAFYVVGIPLGALLAFQFDVQVEGLWIGFGSGICTALSICAYVLYHASWQQMADEARARTAH
ncbi:hypothetical protein Poli38472_007302 [Pythium oligandrum]|uniref:Multidrug/Oligosaccharidyl-lipid/Polysaccharide (MOP) Flippase Superfamily n=1 Tax=Pythium oligandrum TaxID=41045 RepID=A0A8K1CB31_PYTOL|nr:hypothetical protein Poli38472_007302 [Pythium oligandrum]|eukprot:TMW59157.1 hypothetical protein Poli38472_007302 [Pythium oligandrum]